MQSFGFARLSIKVCVVLPILALLFRNIGLSATDLKNYCSTLILVGKRDSIKLSHSFYLANHIPNANFMVVKGQGHSFARKIKYIQSESSFFLR